MVGKEGGKGGQRKNDIVSTGLARDGRTDGKEKGSEKGRVRERVGDEKKESWIIEGETPKGLRRKRGDLAEVKQTL